MTRHVKTVMRETLSVASPEFRGPSVLHCGNHAWWRG